jgi:hypothetical protein
MVLTHEQFAGQFSVDSDNPSSRLLSPEEIAVWPSLIHSLGLIKVANCPRAPKVERELSVEELINIRGIEPAVLEGLGVLVCPRVMFFDSTGWFQAPGIGLYRPTNLKLDINDETDFVSRYFRPRDFDGLGAILTDEELAAFPDLCGEYSYKSEIGGATIDPPKYIIRQITRQLGMNNGDPRYNGALAGPYISVGTDNRLFQYPGGCSLYKKGNLVNA